VRTGRLASAWWILVPAALGAGLAVAYGLATPQHRFGDPDFFQRTGNLLAEGRGYVRPFGFLGHGPEVATALHPPLFPAFMALLSLVGIDSSTPQRVVGAGLLHAGLVLAIGLLARRLARARAGLIAAALAAVMPSLIVVAGSGESEPLFGLLMVGALMTAYAALARPTLTGALVMGVFIGLATLTRSEGLLLIAIPLLVWWLGRREAGHWRRLGVSVAALAVVILPWVIRNDAIFGYPLLSTNVGSLIAGANCPSTYSGPGIGDWHRCFPARVGPRSVDEAIYSSNLVRRGVSYARSHSGRLPAVLAARAMIVWSIGRVPSWDRPVAGRPALRVATLAFYYAALVLGVFGLVILRRRGVPILLLLVPAFVTTTIAVVGWGSSRFRYTSEIVLAVVAAVTIDHLLGRREASRAGEI
jgi:4-amino-4-deoxy-L-arabinose transferase-like glycosyltransferase